jgi:hypothetical protein
MMSKVFGAGVRVAALGLAAATALTFSVPAFAGENAASPAPPPAKAVAVTAPSPALIAGIQEMIKRGPAKPEVREWPDGTMALTLGGSFLNVMMARVQPDGTFSTFCTTAPDTLKALANPAPAVPAYEDK